MSLDAQLFSYIPESLGVQRIIKLLLWPYVSLMISTVKKDRGEHVPASQDSISKSNNVKHSELPLVFHSCHNNQGLAMELHLRCYKSRLY